MWVAEKFGLISKIISEVFLMGLEVSFLDNFFFSKGFWGLGFVVFFFPFGLQESHFSDFMGTTY